MLLFGSSCKILYPNMMFRTTKDQITEFTDTITQKMRDPYVINQGDRLEFQIYSNRGMRLVDFGFGGAPTSQNQTIEYIVQQNGFVILPLIDSLKVSGLSLKEATDLFEDNYRRIINDPFIYLNIKNWKVLLFMGIGEAQVVPIEDRYTNIVDLFAKTGGIAAQTKSYNIKVIRGDLKNPLIWKVDLHSMKSIKNSNLEIRANDIIYVEPVINLPSAFVNTITPYLTLFSTYLLIRTLATNNSAGSLN